MFVVMGEKCLLSSESSGLVVVMKKQCLLSRLCCVEEELLVPESGICCRIRVVLVVTRAAFVFTEELCW